MPFPINSEVLAAAYDYLCTVPPFKNWNLPHSDSDEIKFSVIRKKDRYAHYQKIGPVHHIAVSSVFMGSRHESLLASVGHEMIHLHIEICEMKDSNDHGLIFQKLADQVCKINGWDRGIF